MWHKLWRITWKASIGLIVLGITFYAGFLFSFGSGGLDSVDIQENKNDLPSIVVNSPLGPRTYYIMTSKERLALAKFNEERDKAFLKLGTEYQHLQSITGCS